MQVGQQPEIQSPENTLEKYRLKGTFEFATHVSFSGEEDNCNFSAAKQQRNSHMFVILLTGCSSVFSEGYYCLSKDGLSKLAQALPSP